MSREEGSLTIKVFTLKSCPNCPKAKEVARRVAERLGVSLVEVDLGTPEGMVEGLIHQIMSTPSIVVGDRVVARGRVISEEELEAEVKKRLRFLEEFRY